MQRITIDYGIDLGTTNSAISVLEGTSVETIDHDGRLTTPSVVWINKNGVYHVGEGAKERLGEDIGDVYSEFKSMIGKRHEYNFFSSGIVKTPEELSSEVLKVLKGDAQQSKGEDILAAVITVPASFNLPENKATKKAANLAGFSQSALLLEPAAAGLAFGFQEAEEKAHWLVYDLGGGTFDAAIISIRDGNIRIVNHGGDKTLGGKLIDRDIVNQILIPAINKMYHLEDFAPNNKNFAGAFAQLKQKAEAAKIRLSRDQECPVEIEELARDENGRMLSFEYSLKREEIESLIEPYVERSIEICKEVLEEKRFSGNDIEKILLVGGPTLTPILREMIEKKLNIQLDFSLNPLTAVSRGAALFAGTQKIEGKILNASISEITQRVSYFIELEYEPMSIDPEPLIGGIITSQNNKSYVNFTIELEETTNKWSSGRIPLTENGAFSTALKAESKRKNIYKIFLRDETGSTLVCQPNEVHYTIAGVFNDQQLTHSVGVGMANGEMVVFLKKGTKLPATKMIKFTSVSHVIKGQQESVLRMPIFEGENVKKAQRNHEVGTFIISGENLSRDLMVGSEIELTIHIDESQQVKPNAYIPVIDQDFEDVLEFTIGEVNGENLISNFEIEKKRLKRLQAEARAESDVGALDNLQKIEREDTVHNIETSIIESQNDQDTAQICQSRLLDLGNDLDKVENALIWPKLVNSAEDAINRATKLISEHGKDGDRRLLDGLVKEAKTAIESHKSEILNRKIDDIDDLYFSVLVKQDFFWIGMFQYYSKDEQMRQMRNRFEAEQYVAEGVRAIDSDDLNGLKSAANNLRELYAGDDSPEIFPERISDIMRK